MSEETALMPAIDLGGLSLPMKEDDKAVAALIKSGDYLPYLRIMDANAEACKGENPLIVAGVFALVRDKAYVNLGKELPLVILAKRVKAMVYGDTVLSYFDPASKEFQDCYSLRDTKDSGRAAGVEFLCWIPKLGERGTFATLFCSSKTARGEAAKIIEYIGGRACTLKANFIKKEKFSWWGFVCLPHTAPVGTSPDSAELKEVYDKFKNPSSSVIEKAPVAETGRAR